MILPRLLIAFLLSAVTGQLFAQVPATDLYLFKLSKSDTGWTVHSPSLLSGFNQGGYSNQPEFIDDDLLYVSVQKKDEEQSDIYGLHLPTRELERITKTPQSEFSPTLTPDGKHFSCIRQTLADTIDQRLYSFPIDRSDTGEDLFEDIYNIGYHAWVTPEETALFLVTDPPTLAWANTGTGESKPIVSNIGRCLKRGVDGKLLYIHKYTEDVWYLKSMSRPGGESKIIIEVPKGSEDFTQAKDGTLFIAKGGTLFSYNPAYDSQWRSVGDLSVYGLSNITRLAVNSRYELAVVNAH